MSIEKAIISNRAALIAKYGAAGATSIEQALQRMVTADAARGLTTEIFNIDDAAQMSAIGSTEVINETDEAGAKAAVDVIYDKYTPDYIMLLDGPDVIPQIKLERIAGLNDKDSTISTDLPYACSSGFSRNANANISVTRVVGRLPAAPGEKDEQFIIRLIDHSINHVAQPKSEFISCFSISAASWQQSTQMSLRSIFGSHSGLFVSPDAGHPQIDSSFGHAVHFINCHGATGDFRFYGQRGQAYPIAIESSRLTVRKGAVVAAECCYGAELYDYLQMGNGPAIWMKYLDDGAMAFLGSTNIAYGPARTNGQADLMVQYFLTSILKGASSGRALLEARQNFIRTQWMASQTNLKTLAQFVLYGDPSLRATPEEPLVETVPDAEMRAAASEIALDEASKRKSVRIALLSEGKSIASAASLPGKVRKASSEAITRFQALAKQKGYASEALAFSVTGGAQFRSAAKQLDRDRQVVVVVDKIDPPEGSDASPSYRAIVGQILENGIFAVEECESR